MSLKPRPLPDVGRRGSGHGPDAAPNRIAWLGPLVFVVNLAVTGLLVLYSSLNLRPFVPAPAVAPSWPYRILPLMSLLPTVASVLYLTPVMRWLRTRWRNRPHGGAVEVPATIAERVANAPPALAAFTLLSWVLVDLLILAQLRARPATLTVDMWIHFAVRPILAGLVAAVTIFFGAEFVCRRYAWPVLLDAIPIEGNPRIWKIRVAHRLLLLWLAISALPLGAVVVTALSRLGAVDTATDAALVRVMLVIVLLAASAGIGGALLAWLLSRTIARPLRNLERAVARVREGDLSAREPVEGTDEIGAVAAGFNLMTERLLRSHDALEARNRELATALDRVQFLEGVKRGLDRFVPDTVRRALEANPDAAALAKRTQDVTVLFLDIEGSARLSEQLPRAVLSALVERYFSMFLSDIRREGGDINETAGDGLMILFPGAGPAEHAMAAVRAALAVRAATARANGDPDKPHPPIFVNVGISSGECDVGLVRLQGAAGERWTYTATGIVTNLAARLGDHATRGQILVTDATARRVHAHFRLRGLGRVALKNISEPVEVWEVEDRRGGGTALPGAAGSTLL